MTRTPGNGELPAAIVQYRLQAMRRPATVVSLPRARVRRPARTSTPSVTRPRASSASWIDKEIGSIRSGGDRPPTAEELARVKDQRTLTLPGRWGANRAVMGDIVEMVRFGLPNDYRATYADTVRALTLDDVSAQADRILQADRMIRVVVGDRARIEGGEHPRAGPRGDSLPRCGRLSHRRLRSGPSRSSETRPARRRLGPATGEMTCSPKGSRLGLDRQPVSG